MPDDQTPHTRTKKTEAPHTTLSGQFYSDIELDDMLYTALIRSPVATGQFVSLSHPIFPEGYTIYKAEDVPGKNEIDTLGITTPIFCTGSIQYRGEPVAILAGPDPKTVQALSEEIEVITSETADPQTDTGAPLLASRTIESGLARTDKDAFEKLFEISDGTETDNTTTNKSGRSLIFGAWSSAISVPSRSETNGCICIWNNGSLTVYTPTQWVSHLRRTLSAALNITSDHIQIIKTRSSNPGSNGIWRNAIFCAQAAIISYKTGKPVKFVLTRRDQEEYMERAIPVTITNRTAVESDGTITAMKITVDIDAGTRNPFAPEILDRLVIASAGCYNVRNMRIMAAARGSHTPPSSLSINIIDSQAFFAIENQIQKISDITGISPAELRKKNIRTKPEEPVFTPFTFQLDHAFETIDAAAALSDFNRKYTTYRYDSLDRAAGQKKQPFTMPLRGIGMACAFDGSGYFGTNIYAIDQKMEATMEKDGTLTIHAIPPSASILAIWKKTASEILAISPEDIHVNSVFEKDEEPQLPESVYSNLSIMTQLLRKCCESILRAKGKKALPITVKKTVTETQKNQWNSETFSGTPFHSTSFATAVVELELDPCTFREQIRNIAVVIDSGEILSGKAAENSIKLDINRILSHVIKDEYVECTNISVRFIQSESEPKQLHGLVQNILPAAFSSALSQALSNTVSSVPLPVEELFWRGYDRPPAVPAADKKEEEKKKE